MNKVKEKWGWFLFALFVIIVLIYNFREDLYKEKYFFSESKIEHIQMIPCNFLTQTFQSSEEKLYNLSMLFGEVPSTEGRITIEICKEEQLIYATYLQYEELIENDWTSVYVNIPLHSEASYNLKITADTVESVPEIGIVLSDDAAVEAKELKKGGGQSFR